MGIIHVLDPQLTNMIAAGEVVDRPVNIVKECVENSLDAGATRIDIEVFEGGIGGVVVSDDGCGMSYEDARMAFKRHATSKLQNEDELFAIATMGFRGEALPSIASVAKVSCLTANTDGGTRITYEYGELTEYEKTDAPLGTRMEVRGLFLHTPARFKYLKKPNYEFSIIADAVNKLALAHPEVRFTLKHDNRLVFQTSGKKDRREILYQMFGSEPAREAVEFYRQSSDFTIEGYAIQPTITRASKNYIYICLNGRTIRSWPITKAVIEGYREYMPKERYPICFINITTDFQLVDVNVHPNKLEVRISKEEYLTQMIIDTISDLFASEITASKVQSRKPQIEQLQAELHYPKQSRQDEDAGSFGSLATSQPNVFPSRPIPSSTLAKPDRSAVQYPTKSSAHPGNHMQPNRPEEIFSASTHDFNKPVCTPATSKPALDEPAFLKDPAAPGYATRNVLALSRPETAPTQALNSDRNRVDHDEENLVTASISNLSEAFGKGSSSNHLEEKEGQKPSCQTEPISYPAGQAPARQRNKGNEFFRHLKVIGQLKESYILCEGDEGLVIIDQHAAQERANFEKIQRAFEKPVEVVQPLMIPIRIPLTTDLMADLETINASTKDYGLHFEPISSNAVVLREEPGWLNLVNREQFLEDLFAWYRDHRQVDMKELRRHLIATCACHSSVRFNHALGPMQMQKVIDDLAECDQPYNCPHGRPTVITMSLKELAKEFERV
ncbi:DNA mismatch repair endonuclease MutL [Erysipelotrichaceae bacterium 51-3]